MAARNKTRQPKLPSEFQVGITEPQDLASQPERAGKTLAPARKHGAALKKEGWIAADATALEPALRALGGIAFDQDEALADRAQFTAALTRTANAPYKLCLSVQNAARLQYPSTQPGTEATRARFLLETFPHATAATGPQPTPPPAPNPPSP